MNKDKDMKGVVKCPNCHNDEYVGLLHWRDGKLYCRYCIARIWRDQDGYQNQAFEYYWPFYDDGIIYAGKPKMTARPLYPKEKNECILKDYKEDNVDFKLHIEKSNLYIDKNGDVFVMVKGEIYPVKYNRDKKCWEFL